MMSPRAAFTAALSLAALALAAQSEFDPVTRVPPIHAFSGHFGAGRFLDKTDDIVKTIAESAPDILWMHPFANFNFRYGAIEGMGGEESIPKFKGTLTKRISPDEVARRTEMRKEMIKKLRTTGVRHIVPYTCLHTMGGDHEKRLGFWEFYDHWDDYRKLGLYEKPKTDPFEWNQQSPDGSPRYLYSHKNHQFWPPMYRYAASCAHPDRVRWMQFIVRDMCKLGINGMFSDNSTGLRDCGPYAQKAFAERIESRYTEAQIQELFGGMPSMSEEPGTLAAYETRRCWLDLTRRYFERLRKTGEAIHKPYFIMPNGGYRMGVYVEFAFPDCDQVMYEGSKSIPGLNPSKSIIGPFKQRSCEDNAFVFAHTFGIGARVRAFPFILSHTKANRNIAVLWHAEAAAFGGGGSACSSSQRGDLKVIHEVMSLYRDHYRTHRNLYDGKRTLPMAAVMNFGSQWFYDNYAHAHRTRIIFDTMLEEHILTDVLTRPGCFRENLARYKLIVVPLLTYLSDEHLQALMEFRDNGGELLVYGDSGGYDQYLRKREDNPLARLAVADDFSTDTLKRKLSECKASVWPVIEPEGMENEWEAAAVKASAYLDDPSSPKQLVLHIVNFNVYLDRNTNRYLRVPSISVQLPLPGDMKPKVAKIIRLDDGKAERLPVSTQDGRALFAIEDVGIHTVCVVE